MTKSGIFCLIYRKKWNIFKRKPIKEHLLNSSNLLAWIKEGRADSDLWPGVSSREPWLGGEGGRTGRACKRLDFWPLPAGRAPSRALGVDFQTRSQDF